ncbi:tetratricopeptide repeat protein [Brevundimonas sp.]|uniref:tetratricopeptide repeat protein n=1 Tax=Brevundimonas sp. TaxID=1871086 RepID=UPI0028A2D61B|nr:tetratricopeptide repeat protein [Brevundimonas sp.]
MKPIRPLLLTTSLVALIFASPALAQVVPGPPADEKPAPSIIQVPEGQQAPEGEDGEPAEVELPPEPTVAIPTVWAPVPTDENGRSAYGLYLASRAALVKGDTTEVARRLQQTTRLVPEQPQIREQAFTSAILAGDLKFASEIVPDAVGTSPTITEAGKLIRGIELYLDRGARQANRLFAEQPVDMPHDRAATYAQVWIAAQAGDWNRALAAPPADFDPISALVARSNRARLLEIRRRNDEAEAEWQELTAHAVAGSIFRLGYGEFLERRGRQEEALALYNAAIEANQAEARIYLARQRIMDKGRAPAMLRYNEGVAMALRTAADQMIAQNANEFAAVYLRLAQRVDPGAQTLIYIGQSLINANLPGAGRDALAQVPRSEGLLYANARAQRGLSFDKSGMLEEALAEFLLATEASPADPAIAYALANIYIKMDRNAEALEILDGPLLKGSEQAFEVRFLRGATLKSLGRIEEAEAEMEAALVLQPNDPNVLNYLGYLWVDSGRKIDQGAALIARAFEIAPDNGNIQDSLGWAQFKQGKFEEALQNLEQAVIKEPANAEITDHYGDALWAVGRQREAGFQWQRVLTLEVDAERRAEVITKLKDRLGQSPDPTTGTATSVE